MLLLPSFTKPALLQESKLNGGGTPYLVDLIEYKVPVECRLGQAKHFFLHLFHPQTVL